MLPVPALFLGHRPDADCACIEAWPHQGCQITTIDRDLVDAQAFAG